MKKTLLLLALAVAASAQDDLSLKGALETALANHPALKASDARIDAAAARVEQAKSGLLPKVNYSESYMRGNNPVYVFGSKLNQGQFTMGDFALDKLNSPSFYSNFQSMLSVEQVVYDAHQVRGMTSQAKLGKELTAEEKRAAGQQIEFGVVRAYYGVLLAGESLQAAGEALKSAAADKLRAQSLRNAGMATDADVLSVEVHVAATREQQIRRKQDLEVAQAALNQALGLPLDTPHALTTKLTPLPRSAASRADYEQQAAQGRAEAKQSSLAVKLAEEQAFAAKRNYLPRVGVRAQFENDRMTFLNRAGNSWMFAGNLQWNLFNGFADRARAQEAGAALTGAREMQRNTASALQLEVRRAYAGLSAAQERLAVAESAISMAEESLRITKNRYDNGMSTVTDLLRNETALLDARTRRLAAIHDSRVAAAALEYAAGNLNPNSEILQ